MEEEIVRENNHPENEELTDDHIGESFLLSTKTKKKRKRVRHDGELNTNLLIKRNLPEEGSVQKEDSSNGNGVLKDGELNDDDADGVWLVPKKKLKKDKKQNQAPSFQCNLEELFSNAGKRAQATHLKFSDIRSLFMLTVSPNNQFPNWCRLNAWYKIQKTVIVMAGCITAQDYKEHKDCFEYVNSAFEKAIPVRNEGTDLSIKSPIESFLRYRMSKRLRQLKKDESNTVHPQSPEFYEYVLTEDQMRINEYPEWNSAAKDHGLVSTRIDDKRTPPTRNSKLFSIDCEMCIAFDYDRVLTRISIVNSNLETVYDELVKPDKFISDYLTQYSGITAEKLENVTKRLSDVQTDILKIIQPDSIIVGHSLDFDLRAMHFHHDNIIDTSVLYVDQRGPRYKSSLKNLVKSYLNRDIQNSENGHCSIEDAKACMELVLLKIQKGASFGNADWETESVFEALNREGKRGALIESSNIVRQHCFGTIDGVPCSSDEEVALNGKRFSKEVMFTFAHLRRYENLIKGNTEVTTEMKKDALRKIDESISQILSDVEPWSLVIVSLSGGYVPPDIMKLAKDKETRKGEDVKSAFKTAKSSLCFVKVT